MTRPSACRRGYDRQWRKVRELAIRLHPFCVDCGSTDDLQGDHIVPLSRGGTSTLSNTAVRCGTHNRAKGARMPEIPVSVGDRMASIFEDGGP